MLSFGTRWHNLTSEFQSNHNKLSHWKWKAVSPSISYSTSQTSKQKKKAERKFSATTKHELWFKEGQGMWGGNLLFNIFENEKGESTLPST